jgi:TolA-binding protein
MLAAQSARSLRGEWRAGEQIGANTLRLSSLIILAAVLATTGVVTGCADNSNNMNQLNQNEFALRGMIASDRQEIAALQAQVRQTQDEVAELKHSGASTPGAAPPADVNERLAKLESEINAMQAAMPMGPSAAPVAEAPPSGLAPGAAPAPPPTAAGMGAIPPAPGVSAPAPATAGPEAAPTWPQDVDKELADTQASKDPGAKIYRKGLEAMKSGNYPAAIVQFAKIQHSYAKSPLSEPAQYFIANSFYENGKYEQAVLQFNDLTMRFPNSRFFCESLLREGQSFVRLNDRIDARLTLQKLSSNSNCSNESVAANNMLKNLGSD